MNYGLIPGGEWLKLLVLWWRWGRERGLLVVVTVAVA